MGERVDQIAVGVCLEALQGHGATGRIADELFQLIPPMRRNRRVGVEGKPVDTGAVRTREPGRLTLRAKARADTAHRLAGPFSEGDALLHGGRHGAGELRGGVAQGIIPGDHGSLHARFQVAQPAERADRFCRKFSFEAIWGMLSPYDPECQERGETMAMSFKGAHFPQEIILPCVRWYVAYPLSTRHVEELMLERGVHVDHSTVNRWVIKYSPQLEEAFHRRKRPVWVSWRMDETYIKVKGQWYYLYRAVDKHGQTIDFLLTEHRDKEAA